jgi:hypothetical protein
VWGCEVDRTAWVINGGAADLQDEHQVTEISIQINFIMYSSCQHANHYRVSHI